MMETSRFLKVAAYQGQAVERDPEKALDLTLQALILAEQMQVDILCMPESFLHGYLDDSREAFRFSLDLESQEAENLFQKFARFKCTLLLGLNEKCQSQLFNTVVVIEEGRLIGKYRKAYTYPPYDYFQCGTEFPIFQKKGISYGIIICLDSAFFEPARILALKGAKLIFSPMFNRTPNDLKMFGYLNRKNHFISRSFENHCWLVSSDVIWDEVGSSQTCPGYACIFNSDGEQVCKSEPYQEGLLTYSIPLESLALKKDKRLLGKSELFEIVSIEYQKRL